MVITARWSARLRANDVVSDPCRVLAVAVPAPQTPELPPSAGSVPVGELVDTEKDAHVDGGRRNLLIEGMPIRAQPGDNDTAGSFRATLGRTAMG